MQNETKLSAEAINSLFQLFKKGQGSQESVKKVMNESLSDSQKKAVSEIMADPQKLRQLLSSPQAKELMEKLRGTATGENKNGSA